MDVIPILETLGISADKAENVSYLKDALIRLWRMRSGEVSSMKEILGDEAELTKLLKEIRGARWSVAVHNDYRQNGKTYTFWLFTHVSGRWLKGEGQTDVEAITNAFPTGIPKEDGVQAATHISCGTASLGTKEAR